METETPAPEPTTVRPCATCAAPLASGQDWCLECGSAQPGRLGARAGRRAALTVAAACALLATGAGAAAYAALSTEAEPVAATPPPAAVTPAPAPPVATTPAPAAEDTPLVEAPETKPAPVPKPADDPAPVPAAPDPAPAPTGGGGDEDGGDAPASEPAPIALRASSASTYDPQGRAGGGGRPARAVDGRDSTAWEVPVASDGSVLIGLAVSLKQARALRRIAFGADTPGFSVEVYGTREAQLPPNVQDERWEMIESRSDVGVREEIAVKGKYRHVLLWVTEQPADTKVAVPEIQLFD